MIGKKLLKARALDKVEEECNYHKIVESIEKAIGKTIGSTVLDYEYVDWLPEDENVDRIVERLITIGRDSYAFETKVIQALDKKFPKWQNKNSKKMYEEELEKSNNEKEIES